MRVSVIIPAHGREDLLIEAVRSVHNQTQRPDELIVVDDGTPGGLPRVRQLLDENGDTYLRIERGGVSRARNLGVKNSRGEWLAFLDSDDYWRPLKLERHAEFHRQHERYTISQSFERWLRNGEPLAQKRYHAMPDGDGFAASLKRCLISPSSVYIRRDTWDRFGGFDECLPVCEDYDLWLRMTAVEPVGLIREELLVKRGGHGDQLSRSQQAMDRFRVYALLKLLSQTELAALKRAQAFEELERKVAILVGGARRRASASQKHYDELLIAVQKLSRVQELSRVRQDADHVRIYFHDVLLEDLPTEN